MEISGIGGGTAPGFLAPLGSTAAGPASSVTAASTAGSLASSAALPGGLGLLVQHLSDFSTAEIMLALILLAAMRRDDERGGSALGFLVGLSLARQIGGSSCIDLPSHIPQSVSGTAGTGLNVLV